MTATATYTRNGQSHSRRLRKPGTSVQRKWSAPATPMRALGIPLPISDLSKGMERLWSLAGATGGNRGQMGRPRKPLKQADPQPVATHGNLFGAHGKEGATVRVGHSADHRLDRRRPVTLPHFARQASTPVANAVNAEDESATDDGEPQSTAISSPSLRDGVSSPHAAELELPEDGDDVRVLGESLDVNRAGIGWQPHPRRCRS